MKKAFKVSVITAFCIYVLFVISILFLRNQYAGNISFAQYIKYFSNFVPFKTISNYVTCLFSESINPGLVYRNILGNLFLFMPLSPFLYCFMKDMRKIASNMLLVFLFIILAETVQIAFRIGSFDVDDIILNMLGALLGYLIIRIKPINNIIVRLFS